MTEIRFYHLTRSTMGQALPELLEKTLSRGWRAVIRLNDDVRLDELNKQLWTYRKTSFLPHGSAKDGAGEDQPVWLTTQDDCPNDAAVLFQLDGATGMALDKYDLVCDVFDGNDFEIVEQARARWVSYKKEGHKLAYWQQGERGWTKKGE